MMSEARESSSASRRREPGDGPPPAAERPRRGRGRGGNGAAGAPVPVVAHLSGRRRGTTQRLSGVALHIGTDEAAHIHLPEPEESAVAPRHAELRQLGSDYELVVEPEREVRVNGEVVTRRQLASGDTLQIGADGPVLRFRLKPAPERAHKTMREALVDCVDCARLGSDSLAGRTTLFLSGLPRELALETSRPFRTAVVAVLLLLLVAVVALGVRTVQLERQLTSATTRVEGIADVLAETEASALRREDLAAVREEVAAGLSDTLERVAALEAGAGAGRRVVQAAAASVIFLQGSFGFIHEATGQPLRLKGLGPDGDPLRGPGGDPLVTIEGDGPVIESFFTGTAFVATADGLLVTNRHVAMPWESEPTTQRIIRQGFRPELLRFVGYRAGEAEAFDVELVEPHPGADLAILRCTGAAQGIPALPLSAEAPQPGDEVIVLGYPTGIRALLARADETFVKELSESSDVDFWSVARRLAEAGYISPLATRGIVGQVTPAAVVYDAETTSGGSGGPAVNLAGEVVAINTAVIPGFGGSNLGVPAPVARALLERYQPPAAGEGEGGEGEGTEVGGSG